MVINVVPQIWRKLLQTKVVFLALTTKLALVFASQGIRRSFDEFLLNKARSATSYSETNEKYLSTIKQLEDILLPGESNLGNMIAKFFDGLQEIAASPADLAPRVAAMERGKPLRILLIIFPT